MKSKGRCQLDIFIFTYPHKYSHTWGLQLTWRNHTGDEILKLNSLQITFIEKKTDILQAEGRKEIHAWVTSQKAKAASSNKK